MCYAEDAARASRGPVRRCERCFSGELGGLRLSVELFGPSRSRNLRRGYRSAESEEEGQDADLVVEGYGLVDLIMRLGGAGREGVEVVNAGSDDVVDVGDR